MGPHDGLADPKPGHRKNTKLFSQVPDKLAEID